jgi:hypothetical protein
MGGRGIKAADENSASPPEERKGLRGRLASHASGRRSGDQFCVYVFDRFVLPNLSRQQIEEAADGRLSLDELICTYIREQLSYRFVFMSDGKSALALERHIQRQGLAGELPLLNPL